MKFLFLYQKVDRIRYSFQQNIFRFNTFDRCHTDLHRVVYFNFVGVAWVESWRVWLKTETYWVRQLFRAKASSLSDHKVLVRVWWRKVVFVPSLDTHVHEWKLLLFVWDWRITFDRFKELLVHVGLRHNVELTVAFRVVRDKCSAWLNSPWDAEPRRFQDWGLWWYFLGWTFVQDAYRNVFPILPVKLRETLFHSILDVLIEAFFFHCLILLSKLTWVHQRCR